ncbi:serine carboxypeptidase 24-like protein [Tanacetum coccineum]
MTTEDKVTVVFAIVCVLIGGLMLITDIFAKCLNDRDFERRRSHARAPTATYVVVRELILRVNLEEVDDGDNKLLLLAFMFHTFIVSVLLENFLDWNDSDFSMLPTYKKLIAAGYRIWIFSGDTDANLPDTATRYSLSYLNLTIKTWWYPWYSNGLARGWTEVYDRLTFATVRGVGHEVPLLQPERALFLFQSFLAGKNLP